MAAADFTTELMADATSSLGSVWHGHPPSWAGSPFCELLSARHPILKAPVQTFGCLSIRRLHRRKPEMLLALRASRQTIGPKTESFLWAQEAIPLPAPWFAYGTP